MSLTELDVCNLHRLVVQRSAPEIAGRYADQGRYVVTDLGRHGFPSPAEIPALMGDFSRGSVARRIRRTPLSRRIDVWSVSIRLTMATGVRRGC